MLELLKRVLTWWNGATLMTRWQISREGVKVGEDEHGNQYFRSKTGDRRWVLYAGEVEASVGGSSKVWCIQPCQSAETDIDTKSSPTEPDKRCRSKK